MTAEIEAGRLRPAPLTAAPKPSTQPSARETLATVTHADVTRRRRWPSPLTRRILLLNALAIAIPVTGLLYIDAYRNSLIDSELKSLRIEGELFAGALGSSGVTGDLGEEGLGPEFTRKTVRRLVEVSKNRARVFLPDGSLTADSYRLMGPGGQVQIEILPPIQTSDRLSRLATDVYDWVV